MALTDLDRNLLKQCLSHQPGAWQDFVDRFIGLFVHVIQHTAHARSAPLTREDTDDLCSEVFLALLANDFAVLRHFRGESSLATYLTVIARRVVVREIVQRRRARAVGPVDGGDRLLEDPRSVADVARAESDEEIAAMLQGLSESEAAVVRQYHLEGRSYREISLALGIPENSIGPTLTRARQRLRQGRLQARA